MRPKVAKSRRSDTERAAEHYLYHEYKCLPHTIRRAVRTKYQSVDFWGCDVMAKDEWGHSYFAQVTTGGVEAVRQRRRKLEKIPWNDLEHIMVLQMIETPDPLDNRKKKFYFRVHEMDKTRELEWIVGLEEIPRDWFKKLREVSHE